MNFNPLDLMKNAQKIQEQMGVFQEKLAEISATGSAGGGMVEIELNGKFEAVDVRIAPEAVEGGDAEMLQDLVMAALSNSLEKVREAISAKGSAGGGMVEIELSGKFEVLAVRIAPEAVECGDAEMLQDLVMAALSNSLEKIRETINSEMGAMAGVIMGGGGGMPDFSSLMGAS